MSDEIQVDLVSNASMKTYPKNTYSSFTNDLHQPLQLEGDWEVAVIEIFHPKKMSNDSTSSVKLGFITSDGGQLTTKHYFTFQHTSDPSEIVDQLQKFINQHQPTLYRKTTNIELKLIGDILQIKPTILESQDESTPKRSYAPYFEDENFVKMLGFNPETYLKTLQSSQMIMADNPIQKSRSTNLIFIYCDIVREHHVGDSMSNCLRAISLISGNDDVTSRHSFARAQYFPVRYNNIRSISILLTDDTGVPIKFNHGRTFVTLHFRKKLYKA